VRHYKKGPTIPAGRFCDLFFGRAELVSVRTMAKPATKTVLIIDDDSQYRHLLGELLQTHGWRVFEAGEGQTGLDDVRRHRPDVVLCDLLMPRVNGFQVCRNIRRDATLRHTKIVVTSGRDYEADRLAAREAGADEYLIKPVRSESLMRVLDRLHGDGASGSRAAGAPSGDTQAGTRLKFWGVRGSIPTPGPATVRYGGNTSCIEVRAGGEIIILDAGTGLRPLGRELLDEFSDRPLNLTILLTHTHWDHIQGLPFFLPMYQPQCRLRILGYEGARKGLVSVLSGQMESQYFPVPFGELPSNIEIEELKDLEFELGAVRVGASFANHPGICVGYRLFTPDGSIAFFPDTEPYSRTHNPLPGQDADSRAALDYARQQEAKMIEFLRGTDALILDAQYDCEEYENHVGWGHGCVDDAVNTAIRAEARRLFLFHHDPDHDDARVEQMVTHGRKLVAGQNAALIVEAAREGAVVELAATATLAAA